MTVGRPEKQEQEKRSEILRTRLTFSERIYVDEQASNADMNISEYIRTLALTEEVKPRKSKIEKSLIVELNRIGVNLNQIAHYYHVGRTDKNRLGVALLELTNIMQKIEGEL